MHTLVVMAVELTRHQSEGPRGFLRDHVFMVSPDPLSYRYFSPVPSAKPNPDVEVLCVVESRNVFPFAPGSGDVVGSMLHLESGGYFPRGICGAQWVWASSRFGLEARPCHFPAGWLECLS